MSGMDPGIGSGPKEVNNDPGDGSTFVPLAGPEGTMGRPPTMSGPSDATNLATLFDAVDDKLAARIVDRVLTDYDADLATRADRMKRLKTYQGLYASVMKAKNFPFQNAANVNLPVLTYPLLQVQGRLYDMLLPANGKIINSSPTNLGDTARANATETFGNAYIRQYMPEMPQGLDDTLHQVCCYGSAFRRTYWDSHEERVCSDWIPIEDFVVCNTQRSQDPSMRDVPRFTLVQRLTYFDIMEMSEGPAADYYANVDKLKVSSKPTTGGKDTEFAEQIAKIDGTQTAGDSSENDETRSVLEQHRKWRMPNRPEIHPLFDGKVHAVMITVDDADRQLLRFVIREEDDPRDWKRFQRETQAFQVHKVARQMFSQAVDQHAVALQDHAEKMGLHGMLPPDIAPPPPPAPIAPMPPPVPKGMTQGPDGSVLPPKPQRRRSISFFTHYKAFPSEGFYGLGFGDFLAGLNKAINTLTNQHIDGVTLRNAKGGFISSTMKGQRGTVTVQPGEFVEVDAPMGSLKDGILWLDPPQNDPTTMPLVELLIASADKLVASSDLMSGSSSGANRTAKETQILAEQMMAQLTVLARRIKLAFEHEIQKIWRLWGVFLPDEEIVDIVGEDGAPINMKIGRDMFVPDAHIIPAADPRTKIQRVDETMAVYMVVTNNPYIMNSPARDVIMRAVTEEVLRAHGAERLLKLMPPPPGPPQPPPLQPAYEENANFLRGKGRPPHPNDDDHRHIAEHTHFLANSPSGAAMSKEQKDMTEQHIRAHHAQAIEKEAKAAGQGTPQLGGPVGPALPAMPPQGPR